MQNDWLKNILRFIFLLLFQVLIIKKMNLLNGLISPMVYVLFLMLLPIQTPKWLVLVVGFIAGLAIDAFYDTMGIHALACLFTVYFRHYLLKLIAPRDGYDQNAGLTLKQMGNRWFFNYALVIIFSHHTLLYLVEAMSFNNFHLTLLRIFLSTLATFVLVVSFQYFSSTSR